MFKKIFSDYAVVIMRILKFLSLLLFAIIVASIITYPFWYFAVNKSRLFSSFVIFLILIAFFALVFFRCKKYLEQAVQADQRKLRKKVLLYNFLLTVFSIFEFVFFITLINVYQRFFAVISLLGIFIVCGLLSRGKKRILRQLYDKS